VKFSKIPSENFEQTITPLEQADEQRTGAITFAEKCMQQKRNCHN